MSTPLELDREFDANVELGLPPLLLLSFGTDDRVRGVRETVMRHAVSKNRAAVELVAATVCGCRSVVADNFLCSTTNV